MSDHVELDTLSTKSVYYVENEVANRQQIESQDHQLIGLLMLKTTGMECFPTRHSHGTRVNPAFQPLWQPKKNPNNNGTSVLD